MKTRKPIIRPFKGATVVDVSGDNGSALLEFISGMGYLLYEDPTIDTNVIISDKVLTFGDVKKSPEHFGVDLDWWNQETNYNDRLKDELDEFPTY